MTKRICVVLWVMIFVLQGIALNASGNPEEAVPKKALKLVKKAEKAIKDKKLDKALEYYTQAIGNAPGYAAAYYGLGRLQAGQKKFDDAVANLEKAAGLDPESAQYKQGFAKALFSLGDQTVAQRQFGKANEYFLKILTVPGIEKLEEKLYREALYQLGLNYGRIKNFSSANEYYIKLAALPGIADADKKLLVQTLYQIGINFYNLKKAKESNEYFTKLLTSPEAETDFPQLYISAHYLMGLNASMLNEHENAIGYLVKFLELAETSSVHNQLLPLANFLLGSSHMNLLQAKANTILQDKDIKGKKEKVAELAKAAKNVETYLTEAIRGRDDLEMAYTHLGNYYYYCDDIDKAIAIYGKLVEKFPSSPDIDSYKSFLENITKETEAKGKKSKK